MLAAIGATERHLRLVMVANGAAVGVARRADRGRDRGSLAWVAAVPSLEPAVGRRIATFDVPWWLIGERDAARGGERDGCSLVAGPRGRADVDRVRPVGSA